MKNVRYCGILFFIVVIAAGTSYPQISLTATSGTTTGSYTTLKAAFDAINSGTHKGTIAIKITNNTTETASAVLNASGSGSASYTSIAVYPTVTGKTITGNIAGALVNINGGDNVTVDGRLNQTGSTQDLTISNTSVSATAGTSTVMLTNYSQNNYLQYCNLKGSSTTASGGIIYFNGASNNTNHLLYNNVTNAADASRPVNAVYALGSSGLPNSTNEISNNNFYNFFNKGTSSYGINIGEYNSAYTISGNSFYETSSFAPTAAVSYTVINIATTNYSDFVISGNYIGGTASGCGGGAWTKTNAYNNGFTGISLSVKTSAYSNIDGNIISNISWSNSGAGSFSAIAAKSGWINVGTTTANIIGARTGTGSITLTNGATGGYFYGIDCTGLASPSNITIKNTTIGAVTAANSSSSYATNFIGVYQPSTGSIICSTSVIGSSTTANSINATSTATANPQYVIGISVTGIALCSIYDDTVSNLTNGTTNTTAATNGRVMGISISSTDGSRSIYNNVIRNLTIANAYNSVSPYASVTGIYVEGASASAAQWVTRNKVYNLSNTYASMNGGGVVGISYSSPAANGSVLGNNFVNALSVSSSSSAAVIIGVEILAGSMTTVNNIISIDCSTPTTVYGLYETGVSGTTDTILYNTVNLTGTAASGTNKSYTFYSASSANAKFIKNNIFVNFRSTAGGSNLHYASYFNYGTSTNIRGLDFNDYYVGGTGGTLGYYNSSNFTSLPIISGFDSHSQKYDPNFENKTGSEDTLYLPSAYLPALAGLYAKDYGYSMRSVSAPAMGAWDYLVPTALVLISNGATAVGAPSLYDAFTSINNGIITGALEVKILDNCAEAAGMTLKASGTGAANYSSVVVYPSVSGLTVSGSNSSVFMNLNGASNVTIDGRVNMTGEDKGLTIINTSTSTSASTITMQNGASNNTVKYCTVQGCGSGRYVIYMGTSTGTTGNNYNTLDNNDITTASEVSRPQGGVCSWGTSGKINTGNSITNNNFFNLLDPAKASRYVNLFAYNTNSTVTGNSFFESMDFTTTGSTDYAAIYIGAGNSHTISNNYIGGAAPQCGGDAFNKTAGNTNQFWGICLWGIDSSAASSVHGNTIKNIRWENTGAADFSAIECRSGYVNIGTETGNVIGSASGSSSIIYSNGAAGSTFYGIRIYNTTVGGTFNISNNIIGGITAANSNSANSTNFTGIHKTGNLTLNVSGNTIGSTDAGTSISIYASSPSTSQAQKVYGIDVLSAGMHTFAGNTIAKLENGSTNTVTTTQCEIRGIYLENGCNSIVNNTVRNLNIANAYSGKTTYGISLNSSVSTYTHTVSGNSVFNLSNSSGTLGTQEVVGINIGSVSVVSSNFIYGLTTTSTNYTSKIQGMYVTNSGTFSNNIITLGGSGYTNIYGIYARNTSYYYFNSVYIFGAPAMNLGSKSYCLYAESSSSKFVNSIFFNSRSTAGGSSLHYAAYFAFTTSTNTTLSNNDYYVSGEGGILGYFNNSNAASVPIITGLDAGSKNADPLFASAGGTSPSNYMASQNTLIAATGTGITTDFAGNTRSVTLPSMGAYEYAVQAPIDVLANSSTTSYNSLKSVFDAINSGALTGDIEIQLKGGVAETAACTLNGSGSGAASYTSLQIYPVATGISVSGNLASALISLNGAQNIVIDGRVNKTGSSNELTFVNGSASSTAGTSTIQFLNDASDNTIQFCNIKGATTASAGGVIYYGATTGLTGNDNNIIQNSNITCASQSTRPKYLIFSQGTSGKENTGNIIRNNNIYDFLNPALISAGVQIGSNAYTSDWTIQENSFYETTSFVPASSSGFYAVYIYYGGNYNISGNYFGGSAALCGGSPWTKTSDNTNGFTAVLLNNSTSIPSNVNGNTIRNFLWANSGGANFSAIYSMGGSINIGTTSGNMIGSAAGNGSITLTQGANGYTFNGIYSIANSPAAVDVSNNTIGSITLNNSNSAYGTGFTGVYKNGTASFNCVNNTIGSADDATANSIYSTSTATSSSQTLTGIFFAGNGANTVSGNTIAKFTNASTGINNYRGLLYGIQISAGGPNTVSQNTIRDLTIACGDTAHFNQPAVIGLFCSNTNSYSNTLTGNTIYNLSNTYTDLSGSVAGIWYQGSTVPSLLNGNQIYGLSAPNSKYASLYGIKTKAGTATYSNNMICLGDDHPAYIYGLYDPGTANNNCSIYFNTIYIKGNPSINSGLTTAFYSYDTANVKDIRNNIFCNMRPPVSEYNYNYCAAMALVQYLPDSITMGSNLYYSYDTSSVFGIPDEDYTFSFAAWKSAVQLDINSAYGNPNFVNPNAAAPDLHIQNPTPVEGAGFAVGSVTTDFDGQLRSSLGPVDVGADAGDFTLSADIFPPLISFTRLGNADPQNRILTEFASIADNNTLASGDSAPRLYYKRGTDNDAFGGNTSADNGWKYVTAAGSNPFSFTIDYSLLFGGSALRTGELIQYFIAAQDVSGNFISFPAAAGAEGTPAIQHITRKPANPLGYYIQGSMSGTYSVGTGQTYGSLTGVSDGIFAAINAGTVEGNIIINITSNLAETGGVALNKWTETGIGGYTLTISPAGADVKTISGSYADGLIRLNGAERVTINGSFNGRGRYLAFSNDYLNTSFNRPQGWGKTITVSNNSRNITIKNSNIFSRYCPVYTENSDNTIIENNNIYGDTAGTDNGDLSGIFIGAGSYDTKILRNTIHDFYNSNTWGSFRSAGIYVYINADTLSEIINNMIYNIRGSGSEFMTDNNPAGICLKSGGPVNIYNNSINLYGAALGVNNINGFSSCVMFMSGSTPVINCENNIFMNGMNRIGSSTILPSTYLVYSQLPNTVFASMDYNNYYSVSGLNVTANTGYLGTVQADLALWKMASGKDVHSLSVNPLYHMPANLHLIPPSPLVGKGTPLGGITTDIDGELRNETTPCIGADEFAGFASAASGHMNNPLSGVENTIVPRTAAGGVSFFTSGNLSGDVSGFYFNNGRTGEFPSGVSAVSDYFWVISTDMPSFTGSLRLYFDEISGNGFTDTSNMVLLKREGSYSDWQIYSNVTRGVNFIQANNLSSFSEFAIGSGSGIPLPIELTSFSASAKGRDVTLKWKTSAELNNAGFEVERKGRDGKWIKLIFIQGHGNSSSPIDYYYADKKLPGGKFTYRLKQMDFDGSFCYSSEVNTEVALPSDFILLQNYPNPFNPSTMIEYQLPVECKVMLELFSITGQRVAVLINDVQSPGFYVYPLNAARYCLASGIYIYRLTASGREKYGSFTQLKKMILVK